jgi:hypothetical protein
VVQITYNEMSIKELAQNLNQRNFFFFIKVSVLRICLRHGVILNF